MRQINLKPIGEAIGQICEVAAYGLVMATLYKVGAYITKESDNAPIGYNDAVDAIMDSIMFSGDKREAISALKRNGTAEYYRAVVRVVKDTRMFSGDKINMIRILSEEK